MASNLTAYEFSSWILKEEEKTTKPIGNEVKKTWTILDGWKDIRRRRNLINFLVNNPHGTIFLKCVDAIKDSNLLLNYLTKLW